MNLVKVLESNASHLFSYWNEAFKEIPYFLAFDIDEWKKSLLHDIRDGEKQFYELVTYYAEEEGTIVGFIQFGQPNIYCDAVGVQWSVPQLGVIRNLYFDKNQIEVGRKLMELAEAYFTLNEFKSSCAFNHDLGASSHTYHGKLHETHLFVQELLSESGYTIEHENIYYSKHLIQDKRIFKDLNIECLGRNEAGIELMDLMYKGGKIGECKFRYFDQFKLAYMKKIWIDENFTHKGLGTKFMRLICCLLCENGYERLDLDTAHTNNIAQRYYEKNGFLNKGFTRSYIKLEEAI